MSEWVRVAFQKAWHTDRFAGREPDLEHYLELFPAHTETVRDEFERNAEGTAELPTESRAGHYSLIKPLGRGGQATVFLARDDRLQRKVALKILDRPSSEAGLRLMREATLAARLEHPGICKVYEVGIASGKPFLAMALVPGETLAQHLSRAAAADTFAFSVPEVLALLEQLARTLHVAHEAGVVHRDIKPGNVILQPDGQAVVLDFGLARQADQHDLSLTRTDAQPPGTPAYMSPEQISGIATPDRTTDVWALGVLLFECLTGHLPFQAATRVDLQQAIRQDDPKLTAPRVSPALKPVLYRALAKQPAQRYRSAAELADDLARIRQGEQPVAQLPGWMARVHRGVRRHPTLTAVLGLLLAGGSIAFDQGRRVVNRERELRQEAQLGFDQLRQLVSDILFNLHQPLSDLPGSAPLQRQLVERALRYLELLEQRSANPELLGEMAAAYIKLGDALGHPGNQNLGQIEGAAANYARALDLAERQRAAVDTADTRLLVLTARSRSLDLTVAQGRWATAQPQVDGLLRDATALATEHPEHRDSAVLLLNLSGSAGKIAVELGHSDLAQQHLRRAVQVARDLARKLPNTLEGPLYLSGSLINLGLHLEQAGRVQTAQAHLEEADQLITALGAKFRDSVQVWRVLTAARIPLARLQARRGARQEAIANIDGALRIQRELARRCGGEPTVQRGLCHSLSSSIGILEALDAEPTVQQLLRELPQAAEQLAIASPGSARDQSLVLTSLLGVTWRWLERGLPDAGRTAFQHFGARLASCQRLGLEVPDAEWIAAEHHLLAALYTSQNAEIARQHLAACRGFPATKAKRPDWPADILLVQALLAQSEGKTATLRAAKNALSDWLTAHPSQDRAHRRFLETALSRLDLR